MNTMLRTMLSAALLAAFAVGQDGAAALARARLLEQQEGDLKAAEGAYRALLGNAVAKDVQQQAALRLGTMLWRLDRKEEAKGLLERAAAAGGEVAAAAQAVLQGKGEANPQEAEVAVKVQDALDRLLGRKPAAGDPEKDLLWLGTAAVPTLIRELEQRKAAVHSLIEKLEQGPGTLFVSHLMNAQTGTVQQGVAQQGLGQADRIARFLWQIGDDEAERYLRAAVADGDVRWRRLIAYASRSASETMLPLVQHFLQDPDPEGVVPREVVGACAARLPVAALLPLLGSPIAAVRTRTWLALRDLGVWNDPVEGGKALAVLEPRLLPALADPEPETARTAFQLLGRAAATPRGTELLLEWLPRVPVFEPGGVNCRDPKLGSVLRAARALGSYDTIDERRGTREFLRQVADIAVGRSADRTAAQILDLVELGYDQRGHFVPIAVKLATDPADLVRAATLLDRCIDPSQAIGELGKRDLPAAALLPLQQRLLARLRDVPVQEPPQQDKSQQPLPEPQRLAANECIGLLQAIAKTSSPDAAPFLQQLCAQRPDFTITVAWAGALPLAERCDAPAVSALLRELLVSPHVWHPSNRDELFAELVHRGDRDAIPLYGKAYELGLARSGRKETRTQSVGRGVGWLLARDESRSNAEEQSGFSGYDNATAATVWSTLFEGPALPKVLADLASWKGEIPGSVTSLLLPVFVRRLPELTAIFTDPAQPTTVNHGTATTRGGEEEAYTATMLATLRRTCEILARGTPDDDAPASQQYRDGIATLLANPEVRFTVALAVADRAARYFLPQLKELLRTNSPTVLASKLVKAGIAIEPADWVTMLGAKSTWDRQKTLDMLNPPVADEVQRAVEARLDADEPDDVRVAACKALGRLLSATSVTSLLPVLRDPNQSVREAATEALQRIRLYHEQTAFWQNFQQGIDTSQQAAAAKLLAQAKPDQPKDQRLLAIRSLAVLAAPEALPYLIDWTKDQDATIAEAARAAVAQIHQAAGAGATKK